MFKQNNSGIGTCQELCIDMEHKQNKNLSVGAWVFLQKDYSNSYTLIGFTLSSKYKKLQEGDFIDINGSNFVVGSVDDEDGVPTKLKDAYKFNDPQIKKSREKVGVIYLSLACLCG